MTGGWPAVGLALLNLALHVLALHLLERERRASEPSPILGRRLECSLGAADTRAAGIHDVADRSLAGTYELVCMFEVLHDVARSVDLLRTVKRLLAPGRNRTRRR